MELVIVCHLENDLSNKFGEAKFLPAEKQTFAHVPRLLGWLSGLNIPMTVAVMVGGQARNRLLEVPELTNLLSRFEPAIHYHAEELIGGQWRYQKPLNETEYRLYHEKFVSVLGQRPESVVFGKWIINGAAYPVFQKLGITHDGSEIARSGIIKSPYKKLDLTIVPALSFSGRPVNPLTRFSDYLMTRDLLNRHSSQNLLVHLAFHSYDLFSFGQGSPQFRPSKQKRLLNIFSQMNDNKIKIKHLRDCMPGAYESLENIPQPWMVQLSQKLGH